MRADLLYEVHGELPTPPSADRHHTVGELIQFLQGPPACSRPPLVWILWTPAASCTPSSSPLPSGRPTAHVSSSSTHGPETSIDTGTEPPTTWSRSCAPPPVATPPIATSQTSSASSPPRAPSSGPAGPPTTSIRTSPAPSSSSTRSSASRPPPQLPGDDEAPPARAHRRLSQ